MGNQDIKKSLCVYAASRMPLADPLERAGSLGQSQSLGGSHIMPVSLIRQLRAATASTLIVASALLPGTAKAQDNSWPGEDGLARAVLPYAPWIFDLVVQVSRTFAEITYDRRGFDSVTGTFYVTDLRVKRDPADVTIGRLRGGVSSIMIEDIAVDTRKLDLPPELREGLRQIGRDTIEGNVLLTVRPDVSRRNYDIAMRYDMDDIGALAITASLENFHLLVPLADIEYGALSNEPVISGSLRGASIAYQDHGLMGAAMSIAADQSGMSADQLKLGILALPSQLAAQMLNELPGGASPELKAQVFAWAASAEAFLRGEDAIRITLTPPEPVPLEWFQAGLIDETIIAALNPSVSNSFAELAPPAPAESGVGHASALMSGIAAPQDRAAGVRELLALADGGDVDAIKVLASTLGGVEGPALTPEENAELYSYLLVGRAAYGGVSDRALYWLSGWLPREIVLAAERRAGDYFRQYFPDQAAAVGAMDAATIGGHDANAIRAAAYDFYDGTSVPRDFTRSLALALVAAAASDPFAADLRDRLMAAEKRKAILLDAETAQSQAAELWTAWLASRPDTVLPPPAEIPIDATPPADESEEAEPEPAKPGIPATPRTPG
jgi:hypothetical protein